MKKAPQILPHSLDHSSFSQRGFPSLIFLSICMAVTDVTKSVSGVKAYLVAELREKKNFPHSLSHGAPLPAPQTRRSPSLGTVFFAPMHSSIIHAAFESKLGDTKGQRMGLQEICRQSSYTSDSSFILLCTCHHLLFRGLKWLLHSFSPRFLLHSGEKGQSASTPSQPKWNQPSFLNKRFWMKILS